FTCTILEQVNSRQLPLGQEVVLRSKRQSVGNARKSPWVGQTFFRAAAYIIRSHVDSYTFGEALLQAGLGTFKPRFQGFSPGDESHNPLDTFFSTRSGQLSLTFDKTACQGFL